jgi:hypothetical protein
LTLGGTIRGIPVSVDYPLKEGVMPIGRPDEELLRADLRAASESLEVARANLWNDQITHGEAQLLYSGALSRSAVALRRFSALTLDGTVQGITVRWCGPFGP